MAKIVPRWEWRAFAKRIDIGIDPGSFERTRHVESSEIYLVSPASRANPKIRDAKMDIKTLERVNRHGLEQWKPEMKAEFPLSPNDFATVCGALGIANPDPGRDVRDLEDLLALIGGHGRAMAVGVEKVRDQYDVNGCTVEVSDVAFDGDTYRTVAAENENENLVWDTVGLLGLQGHANVNYVEFMKEIKGLN